MIFTHRFDALRSRRLRVAVILAFMLSFGMATVTGIIAPRSLQVLCASGTSGQLVVIATDTQQTTPLQQDHSLKCSLCLAYGLSADFGSDTLTLLPEPAYERMWLAAELQAALALPPLPARGPPQL